MDGAILVAKTKALIRCAVNAQLICVFVFAHADCWFSGAAFHIRGNNFPWQQVYIS